LTGSSSFSIPLPSIPVPVPGAQNGVGLVE
jgi:hypothetical protein